MKHKYHKGAKVIVISVFGPTYDFEAIIKSQSNTMENVYCLQRIDGGNYTFYASKSRIRLV